MVGSRENASPGETEAPGNPSIRSEDTEKWSGELEDHPAETLAGQIQEFQERYPVGDRALLGNYKNLKN